VSVNSIRGPIVIGAFFADAQGRSVVIAFDVGQPEPSLDKCPPPDGGTTTTTSTTVKPNDTTTTTSTTLPNDTTTTSSSSTTSSTTSTTTLPPGVPTLFGVVPVVGVCAPGNIPRLNITFGTGAPNGSVGTLSFAIAATGVSVGTPIQLPFQAGATVQVAYPPTTQNVTLTYVIPDLLPATANAVFPANCTPIVTTTTQPPVPNTNAATTTTVVGATTTTVAGATTTTVPGATTTTTLPLAFGGTPPPATPGATSAGTPGANPGANGGTPTAGSLPSTGSKAGDVAGMAVLVAAAGCALVLVARRRREA